jgi:phosphonate transport system substrate-binding protein
MLAALVVAASLIALYQLVLDSPPEFMGQDLVPQRSVILEGKNGSADTSQLGEQPSLPLLRVAIAPVISPEESIRVYEGFVDYLARELSRRPVMLQRETYAETNELVRYGRCDAALICTYAFVRGELEFDMQILAIPVIDGAITYHSLIVVPETSEAVSLLDLKGKRFASADIISTSGWLYPAVWLRERGIDANQFFLEHLISGSHDRSIRAVSFGYVDGAAVDSLVYKQVVSEDSSVLEATKVIQKSPAYGMPPLVVSPQIDPALRKGLLSVLLGMHEDAGGRKVLASLAIDRFVVPDNTLYDDIREGVRIWESP